MASVVPETAMVSVARRGPGLAGMPTTTADPLPYGTTRSLLAQGWRHPVDRTASGDLSPREFLRRSSQPATMPVKLPVFCLAACVRVRYFTCAHQPTLTGR